MSAGIEYWGIICEIQLIYSLNYKYNVRTISQTKSWTGLLHSFRMNFLEFRLHITLHIIVIILHGS